MRKLSKVLSLILNLVLFLGIAFAFVNRYFVGMLNVDVVPFNPMELGIDPWLCFNLVLGLAALLMVFANIAALAKNKATTAVLPVALKFVALIALLVLAGFRYGVRVYLIGYVGGTPDQQPLMGDLTNWNINILYLGAPALGLLSFLFFDKGRKLRIRNMFAGIILPLLYGVAWFLCDMFRVMPNPTKYNFLSFAWWNENTWKAGAIYLGAVAVLAIVLGLIVLIIHNIGAAKKGAVMAEKAPKAAKAAKAAKKGGKKAAAEPAKQIRILKSYYNPSLTYHVSKLGDGRWEVEGNGIGRKVFDSQIEAIRFANAEARESGASIRIHA